MQSDSISKLWVRLNISTLITRIVLFLVGVGLALFVLGIPATYFAAVTNLQLDSTQFLIVEQVYSFVPLFFVFILLLWAALLGTAVFLCV